MNTLQELNNYNNSFSFSYSDTRVAGVTFDRTTPTNQSLVVNEGATFTHPIGIEITEIINYSTALPTLTIDLSAVAGLTINWASVPAGVTVTEISTRVWRVSGLTSLSDWTAMKQPTITCPQSIPNAFFGTFTYTSTIAYVDGALGNQTKAYTVSVNVLDVTFNTNPTTFSYDPSSTAAITGYPQIINVDATYPGATFTVVGTPSSTAAISTISSSGGGGSFSFNNTTKAFTISGTRAQVNARLASLSLTSTSTETDFTLNYLLTNNQDATNDSKNQQIRNTSTQYLTNASVTVNYVEDTTSYATPTGTPNITHLDSDGLGTYTMEVFPADTSYILDMFSSGVGGAQSFNNATKKLTITGTRTQVNSHLNNISFRPGEDVQILFQMNYKLTLPSPSVITVTKTQNYVCSLSHDEVSNIEIARTYVANNSNLIFASSTPQIIDQDSIDPNNYTITLTCSFGQWQAPTNFSPLVYGPVQNPVTITGDKTTLNQYLSVIKFWPNFGVSSNGTFTYTQSKNGILQVSTTVALNGSAGSYTNNFSYTFYATTTWTPSIEDVLYGQVSELTVVGGGGGGGALGGGGGGGGYVNYVSTPFNMSSNTTYTITVGTGGTGANPNTLVVANYGNASSAFGYTANGGGPGQTYAGGMGQTTNDGGVSGLITNFSPLVYTGFAGGTGFIGGGSGGGGGGAGGAAGANGTNSVGGSGAIGQTTAIYSVFGSGGGGGGQNGGGGGNIYAGRGASVSQNPTSRDPNWNGIVPSNPEISSQVSPAPTVNAYGGGGGGGGGFGASQSGAQGNNGLVRFRIIPR